MYTLRYLLCFIGLFVPMAFGHAQSPARSGLRVLAWPPLDYPNASRRFGEEGLVRLELTISPSGVLASVVVTGSSGYPRLDAAAIKQVQSARFANAVDANGSPVDGKITVPIEFKLDGDTSPRDPSQCGDIGLSVAPMAEDVVKAASLPKGALLVTAVKPGGPAERLGMQKGDAVIKVNGWAGTTVTEFHYALSRARADEIFEIAYLRSGVRKDVRIPVESVPVSTQSTS